ncbi:oligoendopeptidase F [candidate division KSB1 bacterium]|nr:oligoendopeptidase F [candidate division KSB1 bacterium]RQW11063.1 MAG: oligoendopeptidase F [candidate division KSB1 bacterium]
MNKAGLVMILSSLFIMEMAGAQMERAAVEEQYKWNLADLYESDDAWRAKKEELEGMFDKVLDFKGKLASSPQTLRQCLDFQSALSKEFVRLFMYARMNSDLDTRDPKFQGMGQEMAQMGTRYSSLSSFIEPEILAMDAATIDRFISEEKGLRDYEFYLKDLQRKKAHRLSEKEERIIAEAGLVTGSADEIYNVFSNAELPYPEVELSDGSKATLTAAGYARYRASENRGDRELVMQEFFGALKKYGSTFATSLSGSVNAHLFYTRARNYESCLANALDGDNIPPDVYHSLVSNVNNNLGSFHRYLEIKRRMLGVEQLKYSDLYAPTVEGVDLKYTIDEAYDIVLQAFKPLGDDYVNTVKMATQNRWIDVYPTTAKASGAYSSGDAYDVHPFILLNFNGTYNDVSTLAHELGHTMHSYYSNKNQPYPLANYSIFVAEVASTFNEALLIDHMLKEIKDDDVILSLLMEYLDGLKGTVFRQTQFAEFELKMHEMAERGEALTSETLTKLYADIVRRYYGHDKGVCLIDDVQTYEWAFIPHFYRDFYVYQYSTSFCASTALSEKVLQGEKGALEHYISFISAGGSDYPIKILKKAGVDMTTADPFDKTMAKMNRVMDEIEKILQKKGI